MRNKLIELVEASQLRTDFPEFRVGDNVRVHVRIREGGKERIQIFEGLVISKKESGTRETFTVRKISFGIGVNRTFPLHSPLISAIEVVRSNKVRRAKLYYMKNRAGKSARLKEIKR
ncbi:50S ribosomal protein L19 [Mycoplasmopsis agalactiae 14628]|uniref:Large ribosomal subunit protein bL19 n=3 Tax=Mycoplasmopsis agalactiae TaxID=2110 RepID=RL19_MYCAP|nr:50S ribosomal protein L19 [Mycoplasmopsis agalactiae]A5IZ68.1 RecName: Full=Large ribosomal subunit protein bL19; AltName: Full=50S ribosomal protein L19 [Mycoplasmopsis agalactiae PG2]EIN15163.1 50S ribosomal protein L19 [Mycoplasmopsis agalactiae 14628]KAB6718651.1 50S ribosomal protein L19 [Mycoplasmopsis agalactiae]MCE6056643.1 50S ribosomal protein L19 [Mycoplasmopsis agalactiae]MCE6061989.1 50S ribosomal protein L19 [Mycoplasmopsis agalactiae]MCE6115469.1 50S ribosomal protein L19 [M